jgi:hypothetical protein
MLPSCAPPMQMEDTVIPVRPKDRSQFVGVVAAAGSSVRVAGSMGLAMSQAPSAVVGVVSVSRGR